MKYFKIIICLSAIVMALSACDGGEKQITTAKTSAKPVINDVVVTTPVSTTKATTTTTTVTDLTTVPVTTTEAETSASDTTTTATTTVLTTQPPVVEVDYRHIRCYGQYSGDRLYLEWYGDTDNSVSNGIADITVSFSLDGENYMVIDELNDCSTDCNSYECIATGFTTAYFKVSQIKSDGSVTESIPITISKSDDTYKVSYPDTDGDKLIDSDEYMFGTNLNNPDTDGDGVSDYDEVYFTYTDPTEYDADITA